MGIEMLFVVT